MDTLRCILYCICAVCFPLKIFAFTDIITTSQLLKDGETLISNGGSFVLGFFSPGNSKDRYLGIWYNNIPVRTVVWVANRQNPFGDLSGSLTINTTGNLVLSNGNNGVIWSTVSFIAAQHPVAKLLDTGNLVIRDNSHDNANIYLWQSFDYPCDTLLPGMKLGWDLRTSLNRRLSSWKNLNDPSPGELTIGIELDAYPQKVMRKGTRMFFRGGPWNGLRFTGAPELKRNPLFDFRFVSTDEEVYYVYYLLNESVISRFVLNESTSTHQRYVWVDADQSWILYASVPRDYCDNYGLCGGNGLCVISDSPVCQCLEGFKPKSAQSWNSMDWSNGCIRIEPLNCSKKHVFVKTSRLKVPDTKYSWVNRSMSLKECKETCLKNCSCMAYSNLDVSGRGNGCALWFGDLVDIRQFSDGGQDLYIRMPASNHAKRSVVIVAPILVPSASLCGLLLVIYYLHKRKMEAKGMSDELSCCLLLCAQKLNLKGEPEALSALYDPKNLKLLVSCESKDEDAHNDITQKENWDLPFLEFAKVSRATDNFSVNKKLGEGGFGAVYKGLMINGQEIAVKRQSNSSGQGLNEFKNEVKLIAKLQHRNLVKLLGCCIEGEEKILIYEYMPNGSLDSFLFDNARRSELDWSKRFNIICGIARGLLYLHQDSRLRIIHRDLKASNVLLDNEMNPKISDFGLARIFGGDQTETKTKRIVGTYGYMAPEYAVYGSFSVKSDVFSFGILLLEIVSGKKNTGLDHPQNHHNLIGYVWELWTNSKPLDLIDPLFQNPLNPPEMLRCIHVALLCLQLNPDDRPSMSTVVLMLNGESILPEPKQPGFLIDLIPSKTSSLSKSKREYSINDITISLIEAR